MGSLIIYIRHLAVPDPGHYRESNPYSCDLWFMYADFCKNRQKKSRTREDPALHTHTNKFSMYQTQPSLAPTTEHRPDRRIVVVLKRYTFCVIIVVQRTEYFQTMSIVGPILASFFQILLHKLHGHAYGTALPSHRLAQGQRLSGSSRKLSLLPGVPVTMWIRSHLRRLQARPVFSPLPSDGSSPCLRGILSVRG